MAPEMEICLVVKYDTPEEAQKILHAVYSGYAAEIVRVGALYGQFPVMAGGVYTPQSDANAARKKEESSIVLNRVEDKVSQVAAPKEKKPKPVGLAGRKRMGRSQS